MSIFFASTVGQDDAEVMVTAECSYDSWEPGSLGIRAGWQVDIESVETLDGDPVICDDDQIEQLKEQAVRAMEESL
jgi:hypothetical protein